MYKNFLCIQLTFLLFIIIPFNYSFSQNSKSIIYLEPLQFFGFTNSSIDMGYIWKSKFINSDLSAGYILPLDLWGSSMHFGTGRKKGKGFEVKFTPSVNLNRNVFIGLYTGYIYHRYESIRLLESNLPDITKYNVKQNEISNYLIFGYSESMLHDFSSISIGIGIRSILVANNSSVNVNNLSPLYRLSDTFERESNGWHYILGFKLSAKFGLDLRGMSF